MELVGWMVGFLVGYLVSQSIYRVSIKSFPYYKYLLKENYVKYKHIFLPLLKLVVKKLLELSYIKKKKYIYIYIYIYTYLYSTQFSCNTCL